MRLLELCVVCLSLVLPAAELVSDIPNQSPSLSLSHPDHQPDVRWGNPTTMRHKRFTVAVGTDGTQFMRKIEKRPKVSVLAIGNPMRQGFMWNALTNFLKQDYDGPMELVHVPGPMAKEFDGPLQDYLIKENMKAPDLIRDLPKKDDGRIKHATGGGPRYITSVDGATGQEKLGVLRNMGIGAANGSIIVGFDDDDIYDYSYVKHIVEMHQKHPNAKLFYVQSGVGQTFAIDGSVRSEEANYDMYGAGQHAFSKDAGLECPYGGVSATEEHALVDCIKAKWPEDSIMKLVQQPSNGVGYIKVSWSGGICKNVWKDEALIKQSTKASSAGYSAYVQSVLNHLHLLQQMNGGAAALQYLREVHADVEAPYIPSAQLSFKNPLAAKCNQWNVLLETSEEGEEKAKMKVRINQDEASEDSFVQKDTTILVVSGTGEVIHTEEEEGDHTRKREKPLMLAVDSKEGSHDADEIIAQEIKKARAILASLLQKQNQIHSNHRTD